MPKTPIARPLRIAECEPSAAGHLAKVYNAQFAKYAPPFCPPILEEEFLVGMAEFTGDDRPVSRLGLSSLRLLQVTRGGRILGLAHVAVETKTWEETVTRRGLIRLLTFDRDHRDAGEALLAASEAYFPERGVHDICASPWFAPVRFIHTGREGVATSHPHLLALFGLGGYSVWRANHIMAADIGASEAPLPERE